MAGFTYVLWLTCVYAILVAMARFTGRSIKIISLRQNSGMLEHVYLLKILTEEVILNI